MTFTTLISTDELKQRLTSPQLRIVDCRFDLAHPDAGLSAYRENHIPGAVYAHLDHDLSGPITLDTGRHPLPTPTTLINQLNRWGISDDTQVVAYDDANGAIAARLWWLLRWIGHAAVAVLDGGFSAWCQRSYPVDARVAQPAPAAHSLRVDNTQWVTSEQVQQALGHHESVLIDVRAAPRFRGEQEPIDPVAGHVPGAINIPFSKNLTGEGYFLNPTALWELYRACGVGDKRRVTVMCGSGVTACHTLLALEHAGINGAQLYAGSWSEWIRDPHRPIATGS